SDSTDPRKIQKYQLLLPHVPAPGFGYGDTDADRVDFTTPQCLRYWSGGEVDGHAMVTRGDTTPGSLPFPKPKWMTNFWRWHGDYSICFSDGTLWAFDWESMAWSTVKIMNAEIRHATFPRDILVSMRDAPDCMRLVRFLPDHEHCTKIELRTFTFSLSGMDK
ncbi:hypothetical protein PMAYCL1PPCAC_01116, partial [Pristionchus mayeri]